MNAAAATATILKAEGAEYLFCFPVNALIDEDRKRVRNRFGPKKGQKRDRKRLPCRNRGGSPATEFPRAAWQRLAFEDFRDSRWAP